MRVEVGMLLVEDCPYGGGTVGWSGARVGCAVGALYYYSCEGGGVTGGNLLLVSGGGGGMLLRRPYLSIHHTIATLNFAAPSTL